MEDQIGLIDLCGTKTVCGTVNMVIQSNRTHIHTRFIITVFSRDYDLGSHSYVYVNFKYEW